MRTFYAMKTYILRNFNADRGLKVVTKRRVAVIKPCAFIDHTWR